MNCACGRPLHYTDPAVQATVDRLVRAKGEYIEVECQGRRYSVQRHYIALHGLKAADLEELAERGIVTRLEAR